MKKHLLLFALLLLISGAMFGQDAPTLTVTPTTLDFSYTYDGGPSGSQAVIVTGSNLTENATVNVIEGVNSFEVCKNATGIFLPWISLNPNTGSLNDTVYVRMKAGLPVGNNYNGTIDVTCGPDLGATVSLSGSVSAIGTVEAPVFSPAQGEYNVAQEVIINCDTEEATIFYSTDSENGPWSSYTGAITVNENMTIWAYATKEGYNDSPVSSANYIINIPTLTVTPDQLSGFNYTFGDGPSNPPQQVLISGSNLTENVAVSVTEGSNYYEICQNPSGEYSGTVNLQINEGSLPSTNVYVRMKVGLPVGNNYIGTIDVTCGPDLNATVNLSGSVNPDTVATPTFSKDTGTYEGPLTVSISCATEGATIRYTTDGTDPTQSSQIYTTSLNIVQNTTIKAKAWKNDYQTSAIASATYTITYTISVTADPSNGGSVMQSGNGTYTYGDTPTLTATANEEGGYHFVNWTKNDTVVSNDASFTPTITGNDSYVAHFELNSYIVRVSADPGDGGSPCIGNTPGTIQDTIAHGQTCTVHANTADGYNFIRWTENGSQVSTNVDYTFTVNGNRNLEAHFQLLQYTIHVSAEPSNGGTVTGAATYHYGDNCTVSATAADGYTFTNWTENDIEVSTDANYTFVVTSERTLVAHFTTLPPNTYNINVSANPSNGGTVTGGGSYQQGQSCTVSATAANGNTFTNWTENGSVVSNQASYTFTVNSNRTLVANFTQQEYTITAIANPSNGGSVTGGGTFTYGQSCTLTAIAATGYTFVRWTENGSQVSTSPNYTFTVTGNRTLVANFQAQTYTIDVYAIPPDGGTVTGGGNNYHYGDQVRLEANANSNYEFESWDDGITLNPRDIIVNGNATYNAIFKLKQYNITTEVTPENSGTVMGGGIYDYNSQIRLTAIPYDGYTFEKWQDGDTINPRTITVTGNATYKAIFKLEQYTIKVLTNPEAGGTAYIGESLGTIEQSFTYGETCTVHAIPNENYNFINWTDYETGQQHSGSLDYSFAVEGDLTLVANFAGAGQIIIYVDIDPEEAGTVTGSGVYNQGDRCTLKAYPKPGNEFVNWTLGDTVVDTNTIYTFIVTETERYVAHFEKKKYTITVMAEPEDGGDVSGGGYYYYNAIVKLEAIAKPGFTFTKWVDSDSVFITQEPSFTIQVKNNASYIAIFTQNQLYTIEAIANPEEGGTVTVSGTTFSYGDVCTLTASANMGYSFSNWTLNDQPVSNMETYAFQVTEDASFTANFIQIPKYTITATANPSEGGEVIGGGDFQFGEQVTMTAIANENYIFTNWTEDDNVVSTNATYTFVVSANRSLVANFEEISCIDNLQEIVAKTHTEGDDTYTLILVYPNLDNEGNPSNVEYKYQWRFSSDGEHYSDLTEGTCEKQYYYKGGPLMDGFYKVRISKGADCSVETKPYQVKNDVKHLRIYPNPSRRSSSIVVMNDSDGSAQLAIYSTDGRVLHTQTVTDSQATVNISLPQGVYVVYLTNSDGYTKVGKLIIQ